MNSASKAVAIIPARLESSRLPGKALLDICGLPMIVHVYKRCLLAKKLDEVYVATDNIEIKNCIKKYHLILFLLCNKIKDLKAFAKKSSFFFTCIGSNHGKARFSISLNSLFIFSIDSLLESSSSF